MQINALASGVKFGSGQPTGLYNCITSNGDGSYSALSFRNRTEADKYADAYLNSDNAEGEANVEEVRVYDTADQAIAEHLNYFA